MKPVVCINMTIIELQNNCKLQMAWAGIQDFSDLWISPRARRSADPPTNILHSWGAAVSPGGLGSWSNTRECVLSG